MDKVIIKDLLARGVIGISERERSKPQDILVNLILYTDIHRGAETDNIKYCVNYRTVAKAILAHIEKASRKTVEALASDIAEICLAMPGVKKALVRVEKPGAVRFSKLAGVEIERTKAE